MTRARRAAGQVLVGVLALVVGLAGGALAADARDQRTHPVTGLPVTLYEDDAP